MLKPTSVRVMQFILYFKIIMFVMGAVSLFNADLSDVSSNNLTSMILFLALSFLSMILLVILINKRKLVLSILIAFLVLFLSLIFNQLQVVLSFVLILMFFLKSTRSYFRGENTQPARVSGRQSEVVDIEGEEVQAKVEDGSEEAPAKSTLRLKKDSEVTIREATPDDADTIYTLMMIAFEEYRSAIPPSSALEESEESILTALQEQSESAAILYEDDTAVAMVRFKYVGESIYFYRLSVVPSKRRRGYAKRLVKWIEKQGISKALNSSVCRVRQSVQNNLVLYQDMGYEVVDQELIVRPAGTIKTLTMEKKLGV
ncbi:GNAT family N-acetyltransferase [Cohnella sp. WQ 127256]|uniref:GNAT family N-acetyltransferase n=1 Tax=Cohnella sp. WQ 127256 TaxID=2938790 RepID=UPI00211934C0|nr:GNAT family N-acetyltransferase [Cohnella sp. WQ 127256]